MMRYAAARRIKELNKKHIRLCLAAVYTLLFYAAVASPPAFASGSGINCDAHSGACTQTVGDVTVTLEITPRPVTALQDLVFHVTVAGPEAAKPAYIDLGMPAMKMGPNRVVLEPTGSEKYEGRGVIVKCASGRRTWFAIVTVPGFGEAEFVFDVVY